MVVAGSRGSLAEVARKVRSQGGASTVSKQKHPSLLLVRSIECIGNLFDPCVREFRHNAAVVLKIAVRVSDFRAACYRED
jgi:hypothetical protein